MLNTTQETFHNDVLIPEPSALHDDLFFFGSIFDYTQRIIPRVPYYPSRRFPIFTLLPEEEQTFSQRPDISDRWIQQLRRNHKPNCAAIFPAGLLPRETCWPRSRICLLRFVVGVCTRLGCGFCGARWIELSSTKQWRTTPYL